MVKALRAREAQKKKSGRTADLCLEDQLLLALQYWREYRTYIHLSVSWGVSEATATDRAHQSAVVRDGRKPRRAAGGVLS